MKFHLNALYIMSNMYTYMTQHLKLFMLGTYLVIHIHMFMEAQWYTVLDIIIILGMEHITIPDQLPGDLECTGTHGPVGDFQLVLDMDG